jgi:hypothetical protein
VKIDGLQKGKKRQVISPPEETTRARGYRHRKTGVKYARIKNF